MIVRCPVAKNVPDVEPTSLTRRSDQRRRPRHAVECLIPDLGHVLWRDPSRADAGIRPVEEKEAAQSLWAASCEDLRHDGSHIVSDDPDWTVHLNGVKEC